jgi:hypothetical protein
MRREGRGVMRREGREVMRREGRVAMRPALPMGCMREVASGPRGPTRVHGYVTACAGSTGPLAFGEAAAPWGWTALSGVLVTRQGTDDLGLGAGDPGGVT